MIQIINYEQLQNGYGVWCPNQVHCLIVDDKYFYHRYKHVGWLQTSIKPTQLIIASEVEADLDNYIIENNLKDIKQAYDVWHEPELTIQLIFRLEKQVDFLLDNPDFLQKIIMAELPTHKEVESGLVFIYANFLLPEDKIKLENPKYEIKINCKEGFHLELNEGIWSAVKD